MIGYHVTTTKKLARYRGTGCILPPVRFWASEGLAQRWAKKTQRDVILRIEVHEAFPLPDHGPRGHAWWSGDMVRNWVIVREGA